jgi:hypothetical protein
MIRRAILTTLIASRLFDKSLARIMAGTGGLLVPYVPASAVWIDAIAKSWTIAGRL